MYKILCIATVRLTFVLTNYIFVKIKKGLVKKNPSKSMQHAHCSLYVLEVIFMQ